MLEGKITRLDLDSRTVVVRIADGQEITTKVPADLIVEVSEPNGMGLMGGSLEDLEVGYLVQLAVHEHGLDNGEPCHCTTLISVS